MDKITELENAHYDCLQLIKRKQEEERNLQIEIKSELLSIYGLTSGISKVKYDDDVYLVISVYDVNGLTKKWLTGYKIKKDGTPGALLKTIYKWEVIV